MVDSEKICIKISNNEKFKHIKTEEFIHKYNININVGNTFHNQCICDNNNICDIPPEGIIIDKPGIYIFSNDIIWKPNISSTAITVISNNVNINMNGHSLILYNKDKTYKHNNGIVFREIDTYSLINGSIIGFNNVSIANLVSKNGNIDCIIVTDMDCKHNIDKNENYHFGILTYMSNNILFNNTTVKDIIVNANSCAGFQFILSNECFINKCHVNNIKNNDGSVQGFSYLGCEFISTTYSTANELNSFFIDNIETLGHTAIGFLPIFSFDLNFSNCVSENIFGSCDDTHGLSLFICFNTNINNFYSKNIVAGKNSKCYTCAKATGIEIYGENNIISNSFSENIYAIRPQDKQSTGFSVAGNNNIFQNCISKNIKIITLCKEENYGYGTGFGWAPDPRPEFRNILANNITYESCKAYECDVGFDTWYHIDSIWNNPSIINCKNNILIQSNDTRTLSCNECSECNPPIIITLLNISTNNTITNPESITI